MQFLVMEEDIISLEEIRKVRRSGDPELVARYEGAFRAYNELMDGVKAICRDFFEAVGYKHGYLPMSSFHRFHIDSDGSRVMFRDGADPEDYLAEFHVSSKGENVCTGRWFPDSVSTAEALDVARNCCMDPDNIEEARKFTHGGYRTVVMYSFPGIDETVGLECPDGQGFGKGLVGAVAKRFPEGVPAEDMGDYLADDLVGDDVDVRPLVSLAYWNGEEFLLRDEIDNSYMGSSLEERKAEAENSLALYNACTAVRRDMLARAGEVSGRLYRFDDVCYPVPDKCPGQFTVVRGSEDILRVKCVGHDFVLRGIDEHGEDYERRTPYLSDVVAEMRKHCTSKDNILSVRNELGTGKGETPGGTSPGTSMKR